MESDGNKPNNEKKDEINYEQIQNEYNKLEEKNILYRLKRWEKNLIKKLKRILANFYLIKQQKEEIKKQNIQLDEEIKKEMEMFEMEKKEIIQSKEESIKKIEIEKEKLIQEDDKKYNEILEYLNSIKYDKNKLIEFLNKKNIF